MSHPGVSTVLSAHLSHLHASLHHRNDWHSRPRTRALRYVIRSLYAPRLHDRWMAMLFSDALSPLLARDTHLFERWQHRWVSRGFSRRQKLRLLLDHYAYLPTLLGPEALAGLGRGERINVARTSLKDGRELRVFLAAPILRCLEGELVIGLSLDHEPVVSMTLTLCPDAGYVLVGCVQGARSETTLTDIRAITRACHGLRPKDLLLSMVRVIARKVGVPTVRGPGNRAHVFGNTTRVKACYDTFWLEAGAMRGDDGLFGTPSDEPVRSIARVDSKHRSAFRARENLRHDLSVQVAYALAVHASSAAYHRKRP
ncbi:DUF535 family protein [Luteibacter sp. PPL552]|jgi:hypothetical protein